MLVGTTFLIYVPQNQLCFKPNLLCGGSIFNKNRSINRISSTQKYLIVALS